MRFTAVLLALASASQASRSLPGPRDAAEDDYHHKINVIHPEGEPFEDFLLRCKNFVKSRAGAAGYHVDRLKGFLAAKCSWTAAECAELGATFDGADLQHELPAKSEAFCTMTYNKVKAKRLEKPEAPAEVINTIPWTEKETLIAKAHRMQVFLHNRAISEAWRDATTAGGTTTITIIG